jgi:uncharacterized protein (DUF433 family)
LFFDKVTYNFNLHLEKQNADLQVQLKFFFLKSSFLYLFKKNMNTNLTGRITINPEICNGKPTIRGLRITVQSVLEYLFAGETKESIVSQFPVLEIEDIDACQQFVIEMMDKKFAIYPIITEAA